jgi:ATP-binding cassette subfamily F protein uup
MDKLVDHLFIFEGNGVVYDFPGNYSEYRKSLNAQTQIPSTQTQTLTPTSRTQDSSLPSPQIQIVKKRLNFKEKQELERLTVEIDSLEKEKAELETVLSSGTLGSDALLKGSNRIADIITLLDSKTDRWLELSE